jgi:glycine/D-amino acid oxidase-like deaminating enzyme
VPHPGQKVDCWLSTVTVQACSPGSTLTTFKPAAGDHVIDVFIAPCCRISSQGASQQAHHRQPTATPLAPRVNQTPSTRYAVNKSRMLRLADYSRTSLAALREETSIAYDERMQGTLQLFLEQAQLDACAEDVKALAAAGVPFEVLDREGCIRVEPALTGVRHKIVGWLADAKGRNR